MLLVVGLLCVSVIPACTASDFTDKRPIWDMALLAKTPVTYDANGIDAEDNIRGLFYDGPIWRGKTTRVFAWIGLPDHKAGEKVPGIVLVHGGGGTAFAGWVALWVKRGYAAIAMDTCGTEPKGSYGNWQRHQFAGPQIEGMFDQIDEPSKEQWTYHAVSSVILGHSLLRSLPQVDTERIGITGISWGGYLTCIVSGVDNRLKFAVPVYGCGFLGYNSIWLNEFDKMGREKAEKWLRLWDPSVYLVNSKMPMLWVTGTNDFAFPMDSLQKSYCQPQSESVLAIRREMPHGHYGPGENPGEIHAFADSIVKGGKPLASFESQGREGRNAWASFHSRGRQIVKSELNFTKDDGRWQDRKWEMVDADIEREEHRVSAVLPEGTRVYYFNLFDDNDLVVSSEHVELAPTEFQWE